MEKTKTGGIGHNNGPSMTPGFGFRKHVWAKARKELLRTVPLEIVRTRMARAKELGLAYPQYASVLTGTGRDIVAFLFTAEGLRLKLARRLEMPDEVREKLGELIRCDRLAIAPEAEIPEAFQSELEEISGLGFRASGANPGENASWGHARQNILEVLRPLKLPSDAVVMIGSTQAEAAWANAARLAKFIPQDAYYAD